MDFLPEMHMYVNAIWSIKRILTPVTLLWTDLLAVCATCKDHYYCIVLSFLYLVNVPKFNFPVFRMLFSGTFALIVLAKR